VVFHSLANGGRGSGKVLGKTRTHQSTGKMMENCEVWKWWLKSWACNVEFKAVREAQSDEKKGKVEPDVGQGSGWERGK